MTEPEGHRRRTMELTSPEIFDLPVDRLGLLVLRDFSDSEEWSWRNWLLGVRHRSNPDDHDNIALALGEAWAWLGARGLVATDHFQGRQFVTRLGYQVLEDGPEVAEALDAMNRDLHPALQRRVRSQFLLGEYELAALAAMRQVEIAVRDAASLDAGDYGTDMMRKAFGPDRPLAEAGVPAAENEAVGHLFAGAIGAFKNPSSHREVDLNDPTEAVEIVTLASLLLRIVDRRMAT